MKLHLPCSLRRAMMALMLVSSAVVSVSEGSGYLPIGEHEELYSFKSANGDYVTTIKDDWRSNITKTFYDASGNPLQLSSYRIFQAQEKLESQLTLDITQTSSGSYTYTKSYTNAYLNQQAGGLGDYILTCCTYDEFGQVLVPGVWILSPSQSLDGVVFRMDQYRNIVISDSRQEFYVYSPVTATDYDRTVYSLKNGNLVKFYSSLSSSGSSLTAIGFNLAVTNSLSFSYLKAYTAGDGSFSSGTHDYDFRNVGSVIFADNKADGNGGLFCGDYWNLHIDTAYDVCFNRNVAGGDGSVGFSSKSAVWGATKKGGIQIHHVSGEVLFEENGGHSVLSSVSAQFSDINKLTFSGNTGYLFYENRSAMYLEMLDCKNILFSKNGGSTLTGSLYTASDNSYWLIDDCGTVAFCDNLSSSYLWNRNAPQISNVDDLIFSGNHSYEGICLSKDLTVSGIRNSVQLTGNIAELHKDYTEYGALFSGNGVGALTASGAETSKSVLFRMNANTANGSFTRGFLNAGLDLSHFSHTELNDNVFNGSVSNRSLFSTLQATDMGSVSVTGNQMNVVGQCGGLFEYLYLSDFVSLDVSDNQMHSSQEMIGSFFGSGKVTGKVENGAKQSSVTLADNQVCSAVNEQLWRIQRGSLTLSSLQSFTYSGNSFVANANTSSTSLLNNGLYFSDNDSIRVTDNLSRSADAQAFAGGIGGFSTRIEMDITYLCPISFTGNKDIEISGNRAEGNTVALGGGLYSNDGVFFVGNEEVAFIGNSVKASKLADILNEEERKKLGRYDRVDAFFQGALGGALFSETHDRAFAIYDNAHFISRGNYVTDGTFYQLQGLAAADTSTSHAILMAAPKGGLVEIDDGFCFDMSVNIGTDAKGAVYYPDTFVPEQMNLGKVLFSGKYAEEDLADIKQAAGAGAVTEAELRASRTFYVSGGMSLWQGELEVADGARLMMDGLLVINGDDSKMRINHAMMEAPQIVGLKGHTVLELNQGNIVLTDHNAATISCLEEAVIRVESTSVINAARMQLADGGTLSLNVGTENKETAVLTLNMGPSYWNGAYVPALVVGANMQGTSVQGCGRLDITAGATLSAGDYILLSVMGTEGGMEPDIIMNTGTSYWTMGQGVTGLGAGDTLRWDFHADGSFDLIWHLAQSMVPPHRDAATLTWNGTTGTWKSNTEGAWSSTVSDLSFYDGDKVIFGSEADVSISGSVAPSEVAVKNTSGTVSFSSADSGCIDGTASLSKSGAGALTINTANTYSGGTDISGGTVLLGNAKALGSGKVNLRGGTLSMGSYAVKNAVTATGGMLTGTAYAGKLTVNGNVSLGDGFKAASLDWNGGTLTGNVHTANVKTLTVHGTQLSGSLTMDGGTVIFGDAPLTVTGNLSLVSSTKADVSAYRKAGSYTLVQADTLTGNLSLLSLINGAERYSYTLSSLDNKLNLQVERLSVEHEWKDAKGTLVGNTFDAGDSLTIRTAAAITITGTLEQGGITVNTDKAVVFTADKKTAGSGLSGEGTVTKDGAGMLTLNAGNTYSGGTELNAGTIKATAADSFGTGDITVNGGTLDLGGKAVANDIILRGTATLKGDAKYVGSVTVAGEASLSAKTSYKGTTTIGTDSTLTLGAAATMAGNVALEGGTLLINNAKGMTLAKNQTMSLDGGTVSGLVTIGAGGTLTWQSGDMQTAPVLKGGTLDLGGAAALTLTGAKAQVQFGDNSVDLLGKGIVKTDAALVVKGGTVTVNALSGYEGDIAVEGGMLKLAAKETAFNEMNVTGSAAVVNGKMHVGDITVTGTLAKGTNITIADGKTLKLNGEGALIGTIAGAGSVDVSASIDATAAKITAAHLNLNNGTFINTKGIKLAKGQTLCLNGAALDLGAKGSLVTAAGSTLVVGSATELTGSLTLGGGELVFDGGELHVSGLLTLSKPMSVTGSGSITFGSLKPIKGELSALFGGAEVEQEGTTLTIRGGEPLRMASAPLDTAALSPLMAVLAPLPTPAPEPNPVADALVQADWGILDAERAFLGAVKDRHQHAALLDKGRGAAWVSAFGASVRHGSKVGHHGSDGNLCGAAFGLEHAVSETGTVGLAVGRSTNRIAATGVTHLRQETAHVALYGQKHLAHGFTADAAAAWGDTETKLSGSTLSQKSAALRARLTQAQQLNDATSFRTFGGLSYEATESGSLGATHTGSVQNLRAELGAGATHSVGKAHLYAEAALTGDLIRHNPTAELDGIRTHGANPGRLGLRATVGGLYEFTDTWSGTASYSVETEARSTSHTLNVGVSKQF